MEKRITPEIVSYNDLGPKGIFVFGSNESGIHGAGAAMVAHTYFGAHFGLGFGISGKSFAIPTKDWEIKQLPLDVIEFYVKRFTEFVKSEEDLNFIVTRIGCGLAGYTPDQIAPMFYECLDLKNVWLPEDFIDILEKQKNGESEIANARL